MKIYLYRAATDWRLFLPLATLLVLSWLFPERILSSKNVQSFIENQAMELLAIVLTVSFAAIANFAVQANNIVRAIANLVESKKMDKEVGSTLQKSLDETVSKSIDVLKLSAVIFFLAASIFFWGSQELTISVSSANEVPPRCICSTIDTQRVANLFLLILIYFYFYILVDIFISQARIARESLKLNDVSKLT